MTSRAGNDSFIKKAMFGLVTTLALVALSGCCNGLPNLQPEQKKSETLTPEDRRLLDESRERERQQAILNSTPSTFVTAAPVSVVDNGFLNSYCRLTRATFTNTSQFTLSNITGHVQYLNASGQEFATMPFGATGDLLRGSTVQLPVNTADSPGKCKSLRITVESVYVH